MKRLAAGLLWFTACSPAVVGPDSPDCHVGVPAEVSGRQGTRLEVPVSPGEDVSNLRVVESDLLSDEVVDGVLAMTVHYGASPSPVVLESQCDGKTQRHTVNVTSEPLTWQRAAEWSGSDGPSAREYFAVWLDTARNRVLLYGGFVYVPQQFTPNHELWAFDLASSTWSQLPVTGDAPKTTGGRVVPELSGNSALYFGGLNDTLNGTPYVLKRLTYDDAGAAWSEVPTSGGRGEYQPSFFYDAANERYLSVCGVSSEIGYHCGVRQLVFSGGTGVWSDVQISGDVPQGRNGHAWVHHEAGERLVLFGGDINGSTLGDTWVLSLTPSPKWTKLIESSPVAVNRRNMGYVLDTKNERLLIWGGTPDGASAVPGVQALDLTQGFEQWYQAGVENAPPARASAGGVYDATSHRALLGFGNSPAGIYADWWALEL